MRKINPNWHGNLNKNPGLKNKGWLFSPAPNALGIYLEIIQNNTSFEVKTWDCRTIGVFSNVKDATSCAESFRTPLMPTSKIQDIRFIPDSKLIAPKPKKHEKVVMKPIETPVSEFVPIEEEDEKVVEHPDDIIVF